VVYISQKNEVQPALDFDNWNWFESAFFKCISWLNGSFLEGDEGFLKEGANTYLMALISPFNSSTFLSSHLQSMSCPQTSYN
jgi:hypothetical protein